MSSEQRMSFYSAYEMDTHDDIALPQVIILDAMHLFGTSSSPLAAGPDKIKINIVSLYDFHALPHISGAGANGLYRKL